MVKISAIVPIYNVEPYLHQCLQSLADQTLNDIEIICVDDGSTDSSASIVKEFCSKDSRFVLISQANQGQGIARNNAIKLVKGEYIFFVDSDDWIESDTFEKLYNFAKSKNCQVVQFDYQEFFPYSKEFKKICLADHVWDRYHIDIRDTGWFSLDQLGGSGLHNLDLHIVTKLFNTQFIKDNDIHFSPLRSGEDLLFVVMTLVLAGKIYYYYPGYFYNYRLRQGSTVNGVGKYGLDIFEAFKAIEDFLKEKGLYQKYKNDLYDFKLSAFQTNYQQTLAELKAKYIEIAKDFLDERYYQKFVKKVSRKTSFLESIFSVRNERKDGIKYKILTILGMRFILAKH